MTIYAQPNWVPGMPDDAPHETPISTEEFKALPSKNPGQVFIIGMSSRPGFKAFMNEVEYTMYLPDTQKNAEFELMASIWPKNTGLLWYTVIVPLADLEKVREVAKKHGFELKQASIPLSMGEGMTDSFPLEARENVFSVSGHCKDEALVQKRMDFWQDICEKHADGLLNVEDFKKAP